MPSSTATLAWRRSIRNSVNHNYNYRFPPVPAPEPPPPSAFQETLRNESPRPQPQPAQLPTQASQPVEPPENCHSGAVAQAFRPEESASSSNSSPATRHSSLPQAPAPSPHTPLPPASAEFVQRVVALSSDSSLVTRHSPLPQTPAIQSSPSSAPAAQPNNPPPTTSPAPKPVVPLDSRALHFDHNCRLRIDGKPI
jgi:hypothetical protein